MEMKIRKYLVLILLLQIVYLEATCQKQEDTTYNCLTQFDKQIINATFYKCKFLERENKNKDTIIEYKDLLIDKCEEGLERKDENIDKLANRNFELANDLNDCQESGKTKNKIIGTGIGIIILETIALILL